MNTTTQDKAFECRMCGECCQGRGGIVLDAADVDRLARHLGMKPDVFLAEYAETRGGKHCLRTGGNDYCIFFDNKISGCGVHLSRPDICRAWPFFRGNLVDEGSWRMAAESCPGINTQVSHEDFACQGREYLRRQELLKADHDQQAADALKGIA
jgi:Fe-S-cluster containining protein